LILSQCDSSSRAGCIKDLGIRGVLVSFFLFFLSPSCYPFQSGLVFEIIDFFVFSYHALSVRFPMVRFLIIFCIHAPLHLAGCFVFFLSFYFPFHILNSVFSPLFFSSCPWLLWGVLKFRLAGVSFSFLSPFRRIYPRYQLPNLFLLTSVSSYFDRCSILSSWIVSGGTGLYVELFFPIFLIT